MVMTPSNMIPLGTKAPDFTLPDTQTNQLVSLQAVRSDKATVIMFICNHCPFVEHIAPALAQLASDYQAKGIQFIAISSNDTDHYPQDAPDKMATTAIHYGYTFPYLYDKSQAIAKAYQAACTPDFYIFDGGLHCVYRGQFDDSRPNNNVAVTGNDIRNTLDNLLAGTPIDPEQKPSIGCNIKWKQNTSHV